MDEREVLITSRNLSLSIKLEINWLRELMTGEGIIFNDPKSPLSTIHHFPASRTQILINHPHIINENRSTIKPISKFNQYAKIIKHQIHTLILSRVTLNAKQIDNAKDRHTADPLARVVSNHDVTTTPKHSRLQFHLISKDFGLTSCTTIIYKLL